MRQDRCQVIRRDLATVPEGTVELVRRACCAGDMVHLTDRFHAWTQGRGRIEAWLVFPGVEVAFHQVAAERARFRHENSSGVLEITHCGSGRVGWNMHGDVSLYLGGGDLALHGMDRCCDSEMSFPLGYYEGISVSADLATLEARCPESLRLARVDFARLRRRFCDGVRPAALPASDEIRRIFTPLYDLPPDLRPPYFQLKAQELLLYLDRLDLEQAGALAQYGAQQTQLVQRIHDQLTAQLDRRYTIEELSRQYLINTSSLKTVFKAVYGQPIAAYMKEYRAREGARLLRTTSLSVAEIARQVGYESQGKFSQAFKEVFGLLPTQYRGQPVVDASQEG